MIAPPQERLETNFRAFDEGNARAYASFYATDVELQNGRDQQLTVAAQSVAFYEKLRPKPRRTTHMKLVAPGTHSLTAPPEARLKIAADSTVLSRETVDTKDRVRPRSTVLHELSTAQHQRIAARTIDEIISRKGETR